MIAFYSKEKIMKTIKWPKFKEVLKQLLLVSVSSATIIAVITLINFIAKIIWIWR